MTEGQEVYHRAWFNELVYQGCIRYHGSEVSGTRSVARNLTVGGHLESRHLDGTARDTVFDSEKGATEAFSWWRRKGLHGYIRESNKKAVHIQADSPRTASA